MNVPPAGAPATPRVMPGQRTMRIATAIAVAVVFALLAWADAHGMAGAGAGAWLLPVALVVAAGGADEMRRLAAVDVRPLPGWLAAGAAAAVVVAAAVGAGMIPGGAIVPADPAVAAGGFGAAAALAAFVVGVSREVVLFRGPGDGGVARLGALALVLVWVALPVATLVALRVVMLRAAPLPAAAPGIGAWERPSIIPLASLVAVVKAGDAAAYCVGSTLGRRRLAPALSPGKTWEGAAASLVGSLVVAWAMLGWGGSPAPLGGWPVYGALVGIAGMLGDLGESLLKREASRKDSGRSLGPLGGVLDLVDSLLVAAPVAWMLWLAGAGIAPPVAS